MTAASLIRPELALGVELISDVVVRIQKQRRVAKVISFLEKRIEEYMTELGQTDITQTKKTEVEIRLHETMNILYSILEGKPWQ